MKNYKKIFLLLIVLLLIGCGNKKEEPISDNNNDKQEEVVEKKLQILDLESKTRPIAVMINNHKSAQPYQTGLNDAYLVYEMVVEGGITRMLAVFKDKDTTQIGTVRSSRPYYLDYVQENDAIYVHFGWSEEAEQAIKDLKINNINGLYDGSFWRDNSLDVGTEHTVYTSMDKLNSTITSKGYSTTSTKDTLLNYSIDEIDLSKMDGAIKADNVKITYSSYQVNDFKYDNVNKVYSKISNGDKRVDYITKQPFTTKNIITYKLDTYNITDYGHKEIKNVGSGEGYYISNGYAVPITWEKTSESAQTVYKYKNGTEINVNDGNTYIQIQPTGQNLEIN